MNNPLVFDAVVIGAGVLGCSIAQHLAASGLKTALLDQGQVGAGASGANFGMVQSNDAELKHSIPMVKLSYSRFDHLEEELGASFHFRRIQSMQLISTEAQWKLSEERARLLPMHGIPYEFVPPQRMQEIEPMVNPAGLFGGAYSAYQAQLNPFLLMWAYVRRGIAQGLSLHTYTRVTGFSLEGGRICTVHTDRGDFSTGMVVLATAAWTCSLGRMLGFNWNIHTFRASAMVTEPVHHLKLRTIISTADHIEMDVTSSKDAELTVLALTQTPDGHFLIAQANRPGEVLNSHISHAAPKSMAVMAGRFFPALRQVRLLRTWAAPTTYTDDGRPLIGPVTGVDGLILAASYRSAIIHAPLAGEIIAQIAASGHCDLVDLAPFSPDREITPQAETIYTVKSDSGNPPA